jgi:hypothetical protein
MGDVCVGHDLEASIFQFSRAIAMSINAACSLHSKTISRLADKRQSGKSYLSRAYLQIIPNRKLIARVR